MSLIEFVALFGGASMLREWSRLGTTMDDVWDGAKPQALLWIATRPGVLSDRELRLCAVQAARQVEHLITDPRSINAINVAERHANGQATDGELSNALSAALDVGREDALSDMPCVHWATAANAAMGDTRKAAEEAARGAASDAAWVSAGVDAMDAARAASYTVTASWLRANTRPNWKRAMKEGAR